MNRGAAFVTTPAKSTAKNDKPLLNLIAWAEVLRRHANNTWRIVYIYPTILIMPVLYKKGWKTV